MYYPSVDSLTHTVGFNTTFGSAGCAAHVESKIYVAVRCNWGISLACRYNIGATKLPRRIYDGDQITTSIAPGELHYYAVDIGAFDVVRLTLLRYNHDLAYTQTTTATCAHTTSRCAASWSHSVVRARTR